MLFSFHLGASPDRRSRWQEVVPTMALPAVSGKFAVAAWGAAEGAAVD